MTLIRRLFPADRAAPIPCGTCQAPYVGTACPGCKEERPAYSLLKSMTARERGVQPLSFPLPACRYYPKSLCDCGLRGCCVPAA